MKLLHKGWLFIRPFAAVFVLVSPDAATAQREEAEKRVVMIRGEIDGVPAAGAGVIFGVGADRVYIATANHVVRSGDVQLQKIQVQFRWHPGEWWAPFCCRASIRLWT